MKTKLKCKTCSSYKLTWNLFVFCRPGRKAPSCDGGQVRKKWPSHRIATGNLLRLDNAILIVSSLDHAYLVFSPYSFKPLWPFLKGARSPFADLEKISLIFFSRLSFATHLNLSHRLLLFGLSSLLWCFRS